MLQHGSSKLATLYKEEATKANKSILSYKRRREYNRITRRSIPNKYENISSDDYGASTKMSITPRPT